MFFLSDDPLFSDEELLLMCAASGGKTVEDTATGNPLTFVTDLSKPLKSLLIPFTPQQEGTGDPSPSNIRPLLPWDGLTVFGGGKNLLNPAWWNDIDDNKSYVRYDNGTLVYQAISYKASDYVSVMGNTEYTLHAVMRGQSASGIAFYDSSKQYISGIQINTSIKTDHTFTTPSNAAYMRFWDDSGVMPWNEVMLVYGSTAPTAYEPYTPITSTALAFPSPCYGGSAEVISGVLTENWTDDELTVANVDSYGTASTGIPYVRMGTQSIIKNNGRVLCDSYKTLQSVPTQGSGCRISNQSLYVYDERFTSESVAKELLTENPIEVCYELATPQTIQLTPEQITAIKGQNTMWSDADGSMTAVYLKKG